MLPYFRVAVLGLAGADLLHFFMDRHIFHKIFKPKQSDDDAEKLSGFRLNESLFINYII